MKMLRAGGSAGIVIKNTFLSNGDAAAVRRALLEQCNLHTILDLPAGVFQGAGVRTVVLFFTKGEATQRIFYYQLDPGRTLGKTNPLNEDDLREFEQLAHEPKETERSWFVNVADLDPDTCDLSVKNPNRVEKADTRTPRQIAEELQALNQENAEILNQIMEEL